MSIHPENSPEVNAIMAEIGRTEVVQVWCKGCQDFRPVNASYAKYLGGEIESCHLCEKR